MTKPVRRTIKILILAVILLGIITGIRACVTPAGSKEPVINYSDIYDGFTTVPEPVLQCKAAALMDYETGTVLYTKNPDEIIPPASMTKLMKPVSLTWSRKLLSLPRLISRRHLTDPLLCISGQGRG